MTDAKADYDVIIIGGGATGLAAALYSARAMQKTLILEKIACGGQILLTDVIENYPGFPDGVTGPDLAQLYERQAAKAGAEFKYEVVETLRTDQTLKVVVTSDGQYTAKAVIIATGGEHNKLGVPGEETYAGKGVSYCATCDGNFFRNQPVAVVGGGDSAVQEALYLTQMTSKVTVIHRRDQLRASRILQERAFGNPKLEFKWNTVVEEVRGNSLMDSLLLKDVNTGNPSIFQVPGVFVFI
ncbi:MAG: FAD-dependent oxidoreductase, partial [Dehalococcoidia bacterium]|nr:FAD-dependent oxidoreductase [Dehalococcoidia bacterium]